MYSDIQIWEYIETSYLVKVVYTGQHRPNNGINCNTDGSFMVCGSGNGALSKHRPNKDSYIPLGKRT